MRAKDGGVDKGWGKDEHGRVTRQREQDSIEPQQPGCESKTKARDAQLEKQINEQIHN